MNAHSASIETNCLIANLLQVCDVTKGHDCESDATDTGIRAESLRHYKALIKAKQTHFSISITASSKEVHKIKNE